MVVFFTNLIVSDSHNASNKCQLIWFEVPLLSATVLPGIALV